MSLFLNNHLRFARIICDLLVFLGLMMSLMLVGMIPLLRRDGMMLSVLLMLRKDKICIGFVLFLALVGLSVADETWGGQWSQMR